MHQSIILPGQKIPGWPKKGKIRPCATDTLANILETKWTQDAHFTQYAVCEAIGPFRYNNEIFSSPEFEEHRKSGGAIEIIAVAVDVDSPAKKSQEAGAIDSWFEIERSKILRLLKAFPGGYVYRTQGGWRGVWYCYFRIGSTDDAATWRKNYLATIVYLEREFGIFADSACNDWNRLHRVPFGIREGEPQFGWGEPKTRETIGRLESGFRFPIESVATEEDRVEARRRFLSAWRQPPVARKGKQKEAAADVAPDGGIVSKGVWERILESRGHILKELAPGKLAVICPNAHQHTTPGNETSTVLYAPGPGEVWGHPHCSHGHCKELDWKAALGVQEDEWSALTRLATSELLPPQEATPIATPSSDAEEDPVLLERTVVSQLMTGKNGVDIDPCAANVAHILLHHPYWKDMLCYDSFRHDMYWRGVPSIISDIHKYNRNVLEVDAAVIQGWLIKGDKFRPAIRPSLEAVHVGLKLAAHQNTFDSLREHVLALDGVWDGVPRLDNWLIYYMGAPDTELNRAIGRRFLIACIARALEPGCASDMMLILEGDQGVGKNRVFEILFGEFLVIPHGLKLGSKDFEQKCADSWLVHDDELVSTNYAGLDITKSWLTQRTVKFRKAFDRDFITAPRRFNIAGSTNDAEYLKDATNRRMWIVAVTKLLVEEITRDRTQLWSEALAYYKTKATYLLPGNDPLWAQLVEIHESRRPEDLFYDKIKDSISSGILKTPIRMYQVLEMMGIRPEKWNDSSMTKLVGTALRKMGLVSKRRMLGGVRSVWWEWPS